MRVLVTGGCGYIGHYAVTQLLDNGHEVIIVDNLSTGYTDAIDKRAKFYECDIRDVETLEKVFTENKIDYIMDFAAKLIIEESFKIPDEYYDVNVNGLKCVLDLMVKYEVRNIIFSFTAAVYGILDKNNQLFVETDQTNPINPYGETKLVGENMIKCYSRYFDINYVIFRYFNVVGGNKPGASLDDFSSVVPKIINSIKNGNDMEIYGNYYDTVDGTCVRDYIHVYDLVNAHIIALEGKNEIENGIYHLSVGQGTSVLELVKAVEKACNVTINYKFSPRRVGDPIFSAAENNKFVNATSWKPKYENIEEMVKEAYESW